MTETRTFRTSRTSRASRASRPPRALRRVLLTVLLLALTAALFLTGVVLWQHDYGLHEERVTVPAAGHDLPGVLATPTGRGTGPFPLVVLVHGDGEVDATHDGFYRPYWEAFARAGYASLSLDKPADWLGQTMDDRARETVDALTWAARTRPEIDPARIGLWGASQAGWVMPKVVARAPAPGVRFVIAVGTAVNWERQGSTTCAPNCARPGPTPSARRPPYAPGRPPWRCCGAGRRTRSTGRVRAPTGNSPRSAGRSSVATTPRT